MTPIAHEPGARSLRLPSDASAPAQAREALQAWLARWEPGAGRRADALLVATELVSNAVKHGRPPIVMRVELHGRTLRLLVSDGGSGAPAPRRGGADGGWGLAIVDRLARRWGVARGSTHVWCELPADT